MCMSVDGHLFTCNIGDRCNISVQIVSSVFAARINKTNKIT